jgi:hypothetical protein
VDSIRALGGHGFLQTPQLDRLCREGTVFSGAYTAAAVFFTTAALRGEPLPEPRLLHWDLLVSQAKWEKKKTSFLTPKPSKWDSGAIPPAPEKIKANNRRTLYHDRNHR